MGRAEWTGSKLGDGGGPFRCIALAFCWLYCVWCTKCVVFAKCKELRSVGCVFINGRFMLREI